MRTFSAIYFIVLFTFEAISAYYSLYVFCRGCEIRPNYRSRFLYITLNVVKFLLNLVLVTISFLHANDLRKLLQQESTQGTSYTSSVSSDLREIGKNQKVVIEDSIASPAEYEPLAG